MKRFEFVCTRNEAHISLCQASNTPNQLDFVCYYISFPLLTLIVLPPQKPRFWFLVIEPILTVANSQTLHNWYEPIPIRIMRSNFRPSNDRFVIHGLNRARLEIRDNINNIRCSFRLKSGQIHSQAFWGNFYLISPMKFCISSVDLRSKYSSIEFQFRR